MDGEIMINSWFDDDPIAFVVWGCIVWEEIEQRSYTEVCVNEETLNPAAARPLKWSGSLSISQRYHFCFFLLVHEKSLFPFFKSSEE